MKHIVSLLVGMAAGVMLFCLGLVYNPFIADRGVSPLAVAGADVITLTFSPVPDETIVYTNDGESVHLPNPVRVQQLWEPPVRQTTAAVMQMRNARGEPAGLGIKFGSRSESTRLLRGDVIQDSAWYLYLPEHGSLFIHQSEDYWPFLRDVAFSAWRNSANNWRGGWFGDTTAGPGALGTAAAKGASGELRSLDMEAVESLSVKAFSTDIGLIAAEGRLVIAMPEDEAAGEVD
ncbi:MAG: hypothetical protein KJP08_08890 [Gammaproteobacteria bacterium]|nr:hypothetical protein [Gammaproteobacteria bacterium]NNF49328.1 hypothetical protein [Woeseiaceae bacterium]MBT8094913.1 hypothetical protein [Gammaproteobacteria bacterium]MBT8104519.1 hypothetical protein [Gammaproteobacteria bacterium]NNK24533.1 hypothetical protein [Woeseiaceae bacterium]